jgi:phosphoglycerol transferase MdoB-like AlkP superfamily enzyme
MISEAFWLGVGLPLAGGAVLSFVVERVLRPAPAFGRPWRAVAAHLGLWTLAFGIVLAVTQRPYFAALLVLAELLIFALVSNAKARALREPFVFADFEAIKDVLKHPRLFLPYFGVGRALGGLAAFCLAIYLGFALEDGLPARSGWPAFTVGLAILAAAGAALVWLGTPRPLPVTFDAATDLRRLGFPASLWYYALAERSRHPVPETSRFHAARAGPATRDRPHLVVVQSESFFDARRLYPGVKVALLEQFDAIRATAVHHGRLEVPAWGGNTARSEFAFLTGLGAHEIGVHRFNPHRRLARQGVPTLAAFLKRAGYRTVCVHPYPASFYSRDTVYPAFGFDRFVDLGHFRDAERFGPYVSDKAVADRVCALLEDAGQPTLLFVITMENHGPLHLERVTPDDERRLYAAPPPPGFDDLTVYLRHLANADRMMRVLREHLAQSAHDSWLCWYGDHVPILPKVYQAMGYPDGRTDYFLWGKGRAPQGAASRDLRVEELGVLLLEQAGLLPQAGNG